MLNLMKIYHFLQDQIIQYQFHHIIILIQVTYKIKFLLLMYLQLYLYLFLKFQNLIILINFIIFILLLKYYKVLYPYDLIFFILNHLNIKSFNLTFHMFLNY